MKVAKRATEKSSSRYTLTISKAAYQKIETMREDSPRSGFVESLVEREHRRRERQRLLETINAQYTDEVRRETLRINAEFPIHDA